MDKELKGLIIEIVTIVIMMIIAIPVCVNASYNYQSKKGDMLEGRHVSINIGNTGKIKDVIVYSNSDKIVKINLYLKINKFDDDYVISLDGKTYNIGDFDMREDENNRYYNLGMYEIDNSRTFKFGISARDKTYYDETITYSFVTERYI